MQLDIRIAAVEVALITTFAPIGVGFLYGVGLRIDGVGHTYTV